MAVTTGKACFRLNAFVAICMALIIAASAEAQWDTARFAAPGPNEAVFAMAMHDDGSGPALYVGGLFDAIDGQPHHRIARYRNGVWESIGHGGWAGMSGNSAGINSLASFGDVLYCSLFNGTVARWTGAAWIATPSAGTTTTCFAGHDGSLYAGVGGSTGSVKRWNGTNWDAVPGLTGSVRTMASFKRNLIVAGSFTTPSRIARLDGTTWEGLGSGVSGSVSCLTEYQGDLIVAGSFAMAGGNPASNVARWDGKAWHAMGAGLPGATFSLVVHDGQLMAGGNFVPVTTATSNLMAWNGTQWTPVSSDFSADVGTGNSAVTSLASVVAGNGAGTLYVGGDFSIADSMCVNNVVKYESGTWNRLSECASCLGLSGPPTTTLVQGDSLIVGGSCRCAGTTRVNRIARWDGNTWSPVGSGFGSNARVYALAEFGDTEGAEARLYAAGFLPRLGQYYVFVWNGVEWEPVGNGFNGGVASLAVFDDGTGPALIAGGSFTTVGSTPALRLAKWDGVSWSQFAGGVNHSSGSAGVTSLLVWNDGSGDGLVAAGRFGHAGTLSVDGLALWRDGQWSIIGEEGAAGGAVTSVVAWPPPNGASLIASGNFFEIGGVDCGGMALWNGQNWQDIAPDPSEGACRARAFSTNGCPDLATFRAEVPNGRNWDGHAWRYFDEGLDDARATIWSLQFGGATVLYADIALFQDQIVFAADFTSAGGQPANNFAIWDLETDYACEVDVNHSGVVDVDDLIQVILDWGPCNDCPGDCTPCRGDGFVNADDLTAVILGWGPCP
jgi:hypothetical protein